MRALNPHIGAYLELDGGERLGVGAAAAEDGAAGARPAGRPTGGRCCSAAREGVLRALACVQPAGKHPMEADAYLRGHPLPRLAPSSSEGSDRGPGANRRRVGRAPRRLRGSPPRLRARRVGRSRIPRRRRAPRSRRSRASPGAGASRTARCKRRGTADHLIELLAGAARRPARPAGAGRAATRPVRAAVVRSHARPRRGRPGRRAGQGGRRGSGLRAGGAPSRRGARQRRPAPGGPRARRSCWPEPGRLDPGRARRSLHSYPDWLARMWWEELGPAEARGADGRDERARGDGAASEHDAGPTRARSWASCGPPETTSSGPGAAAPLASPEGLVVRGRLGAVARERLRDGELVAQARGSQAVVEVLDPKPGERVLDLCAAPGHQDDRDRAPGCATEGEIVAVERRPRPGRASCASSASGWASSACGWSRRTLQSADLGGGYDRDPRGSALLRSRGRSPPARRAVAEVARADRARGSRSRRPSSPGRPAPCAPGARSSTRPARSPCARTRSGSPRCSPDAAMRADDLGAAYPELAARAEPRFLQMRPDRDRTDGFFIARMRRDAATDCSPEGAEPMASEGEGATLQRPVCPGCGEPWLRPTQLPGRYRCVYCLRRYELVSQCPNCGEHQTIVRMSTSRGHALPALRPLDAAARSDEPGGSRASLLRRSADASRALDPLRRLLAARRPGRRGDGRRRAADPRGRHGRPLRPADHHRAARGVRDRRPGPRGRRRDRRPPDDRAPGGSRSPSSPARAPTASPSTSRPTPHVHRTLGGDPRGRLPRRPRAEPRDARRRR